MGPKQRAVWNENAVTLYDLRTIWTREHSGRWANDNARVVPSDAALIRLVFLSFGPHMLPQQVRQ